MSQRGPPPRGIGVSYSDQYESLVRPVERRKLVIPVTLAIIFPLHYPTFRRRDEALPIMGTLPFALTGGLWLLYWLGYNQSVATAVGFIALAGVTAEFGVVMLIYLKQVLDARGDGDVTAAVREGALLRVRPKAMTVAVILAGLLPVLVGGGAGSEVMSRIAAPMVGGMLTAPLLSMLVIPAAYLLMRRRSPFPVQPEGEVK
ncbi:Cu/Ag efflux pump CusA [Sphingobium subterraneum]|uniref:Cu/Ag efflux pump CusA n=1 Tax=Sphingobium subterraneum TaxID=627688 RepID=A0A841JAG0_9SPHN|nr:Cu/Ag efflux pump CusA [Sphingobium subterraneum]